MLETLNTIDWASLHHAYGPATDVPDQLRKLLSPNPEDRERARWELYGNIYHQGSVYEATAYAVPFLLELLRSPETEERHELLALLQAIAEGSSYLHRHRPLFRTMFGRDLSPEEEAQMEKEFAWVARAREAVAAGTDTYVQLLAHDDPRIRIHAAHLLGYLREVAPRALPALDAQLATERDTVARASITLAQAALAPDASASADRLARAVTADEPDFVRFTAAKALASWWPDTASALPQVEELLLEVLLHPAGRTGFGGFPAADAFPWTDSSLDVTWALINLGADTTNRAMDALSTVVRSAEGEAAHQLAFRLIAFALHGAKLGLAATIDGTLSEHQKNALRAIAENDAVWTQDTITAWFSGGIGRSLARDDVRGLLGPQGAEE